MEVLRTEGISKYFGGVEALSQVSFSVSAGEKLAVLGPNGAGKTTLINVINGLLPANAGNLYFTGKNITKFSTHERAQLGMSRSFQVDTLFHRLTVMDNVMMAFHGIGKSYYNPLKKFNAYQRYQDDAKEALERVGLLDKEDLIVDFLSHGEKKMLEIVTSIVSKPRLLLLDEPNAGLTTEETVEVVNIIRGMPGETAVIIVAHDVNMVFDVADQIMVLHYGKRVAKSTPKAIMADPKVKEIYLGEESELANVVS